MALEKLNNVRGDHYVTWAHHFVYDPWQLLPTFLYDRLAV